MTEEVAKYRVTAEFVASLMPYYMPLAESTVAFLYLKFKTKIVSK